MLSFFKKKQENKAHKISLRSYSGAKYNEADPWAIQNQLINQLISSASPKLRIRVRDLVRNFPVFTRAVSAYSAFMIGQGPKFKSLALDINGEPDEKLRKLIELSFERWMEKSADVSGKMHFFELQDLLCRQLIESGESFNQFIFDKTKARRGENPLSLMPIEADRLYTYNYIPLSADQELAHGLEYEKLTGKVLAYHVQSEDYSFDTVRVPASQMMHVFQTLRPGQLRGVTPLAPAIVFARAMSQYAGSELEAQKIASRYLSFVTSPDLAGFQKIRANDDNDDDKREDIDYIENALIEYLRPGEEIKFADMPNRPGEGFAQFESYTTRMVALCVNLSYEVLSGDYQKLNYSTSKAVRGDNTLFLAPDRLRIEQRSLRPCFYEWLKNEALIKDYIPSYYWKRPELIENHTWFYKERTSVDPLRDASADIKYLESGLKSPQEVILARGGDPERVVNEIAEFKDMLTNKGIQLNKAITTPLANNPASIGGSESE